MPPLKVPDTLFTASMKTFSSRFLMDSYAGNRTDYYVRGLRCLPVRIFNEVVENIIKKMSICDPPYSEEISLTLVLTSFMSEKLTHLDLTYFERNGHADVFPHLKETCLHVLPLLTNLVHLNLSRFTYMAICNDGILHSIGKNCNLLKYLNINRNCITGQALLCLIPSDKYKGCPELENLEIDGCMVDASKVAQLLEQLPNIRNINYENIEEALLLLHRSLKFNNKRDNFVLKLKSLCLYWPRIYSLWGCKCGRKETSLALCFSNLCPEIENVSVTCNNKNVLMLKIFSKLTSFEISFFRDDSLGVETIDYLTNYGTRLTSLKIHTRTFHSNLFLTIGKACPILRELSVTCDCLVNNLKFEPGEEKTLKVFTFLSSFSLEVYYRQENRTPLSVLQLFKCTRSLAHLSFRCKYFMCNDEGFKEYWNMINTQSLLSVTMSNYWREYLDLTMSTVSLILDSCPELKKLGTLDAWNVDREEIENLKTSLKQSNYDVEIICLQDYNER